MDNDTDMAQEAVATAVPVTSGDPVDEENGMPDKSYDASDASPSTKSSEDKNEDEENMKQKEPAFAYLAFASFLLLIQSGYDCDRDGVDCDGERAFAVAMAVISLVVVGIHFLFYFLKPLQTMAPWWNSFIEPFLALALFIWWFCGAVVLTFRQHDDDADSAPFRVLGTGWLMTWTGLASTTVLLYPEMAPAWRNAQGKLSFLKKIGPTSGHSLEYIVGLLIASFIVFVEAADVCDSRESNQKCDNEFAWALIVSMISFVWALILFLAGGCLDSNERSKLVLKAMAAFMPMWWFFGIAVVCVKGPFNTPGGTAVANSDGSASVTGSANGFVGAYVAFVASCGIALEYFGYVKA